MRVSNWGRRRALGVIVVFLAIGSSVAGLAAEDPWPVRFEESAQEAGMSFRTAGEVHDPEGLDQQWPSFAEIAGVGACWADFDGDGYEDLYIANQRYNHENPYASGYNDLFDPTNRLYLNHGDGNFTDEAASAGVQSRTFDYGCSGVDHDADGDVDLFVYGFGHVTLFRNNGNVTFTDVTQEAGLDVSTACLPYECWTTCSAWVDYDGDGWLDLFVCTFVDSDMEDEVRSPDHHDAQLNFLFRNNGDGSFTELAEQAGVEGIAADALGSKSWSAVFFDADLDGWSDLYVANDMTPNEFYWNDGDGTFTRDDDAGLYDARAGMGLASGDTTGDGYPDLYVTHFGSQHNGFYENRGDGTFLDRSGEGGLASDWDHVGWGTAFVDLDRDGHLDIVAANGGTEWLASDPAYDESTLVYQQRPDEAGGTEWVDVSNVSGPGVSQERVSRGAAFADHDLDGNMDFALLQNANQTMQWLRGSGVVNHWLYVQPVQAGGNPQAVGARVIVEAGGVTQVREIQVGSSFMSQDSLLADFGLAGSQVVDRLTIQWPHGNTTVLEDLPVDRVVRVDRETAGFGTDTLSPRTKIEFLGQGGNDHWFQGDVEVTFVSQDRAVGPASGVDRTEYRLDGGPWQTVPEDAIVIPAKHGEHLFETRSVDKVGNKEPIRGHRLGFDLVDPVVDHEVHGTPGSNGWWLQADLELSAWDDLSGVDHVTYRVDAGPWQEYTDPVSLGEGANWVEYTARDRAGNEAPVQNVSVNVDSVAPELDFLRPEAGTWYLGNGSIAQLGAGPAMLFATPDAPGGVGGVHFSVNVESDDVQSGVDRVTLWLNGQRVHDFLRPGLESWWTWNTTAHASGTYLFQAAATDRAGNAQTASGTIVLTVGTPEGLEKTLSHGPSLYPFTGDWPL